MNENSNINKRVISNEQFEQLLKMVDNVSLDKEQINEKITKIVGEPQNREEVAKNYWMAEIIYNGMSSSGSIAYSEQIQRERMLDEIEQIITECCQLKVELLKILQNRKKGDINDVVMKSWHPIRTLAEFCLLKETDKQLCSSCQELKTKLIKFADLCKEKHNI